MDIRTNLHICVCNMLPHVW